MTATLIAAAGAALLAGLGFALLYPRIALLLLVTLDVSNINSVIADHLGASPYLPQLALSVVALGVMVRRRVFRFRWSPVLLGLLVLLAGFALSFLNPADPVTSESLLLAYIRDYVYFFVVYALLVSTHQIRSVVNATVLVLAGLAALTVFHEFVLHNSGTLWGLSQVPLTQEGGALTPRHAGTSADVNFWARLLILFTPLGLSLLAMSRAVRTRLLWAASTVALLLGVYLTQSRGGFIALFIGLIVWAALAGGHYRKALVWVPLGLLILIPLTGIGDRLATLAAIGSTSTANADLSVVTRERFQIDAWQMFLDAPATGQGIGSYGTLFPSYDRLANYYDPVAIVVAPHNFFLEQAAGGGVLLLLAWAVFLGTVFFVALRTLAISRRTGDEGSRYIAVGIISGTVGWLAASVFLHLSDFRALLLVAAVAAALDERCRHTVESMPSYPAVTDQISGLGTFRSLVAVSVVSLLGLVTVLAPNQQRYSNTAILAVVPSSSQVDPSEGYRLDVVSRGLIVPTLTTVIDRSMSIETLEQQAGRSYAAAAVVVKVEQSRLGGSILVTVTANDARVADDLGRAAATAAQSTVSALASGYQLSGISSGPIPTSSNRLWATIPLGLIVLLLAISASRIKFRRADQFEKSAPAQVSPK